MDIYVLIFTSYNNNNLIIEDVEIKKNVLIKKMSVNIYDEINTSFRWLIFLLLIFMYSKTIVSDQLSHVKWQWSMYNEVLGPCIFLLVIGAK